MNLEDATDLVWQAWNNEGAYPDALSEWLDYDRALDVQAALLARRLARGEKVAGWKIGLTSDRVREKMGTSNQPFGHVMRLLPSGAEAGFAEIGPGTSIEPELVVTMGRDLKGPNVDATAARDAVATIAAGMEINQNRIPRHEDFPLLVADNLTQWAIVEGTPVAVPEDFDSASLRVVMSRNDETLTDVIGDNEIIDDHFASVAALANVLATRGLYLEAGQKVITGSFCRHPGEPGQHWHADFSGIGSVEFSFI